MSDENPVFVSNSKAQRLANIQQREREQRILHDKTRTKILEFYMDARNRELIERTNNLNTYDLELWYELFRQIFGRYPRSSRLSLNIFAAFIRLCGSKTVKFGQNDVLWEALFDENGRNGFKAQAWAIKERERLLNIPLTETSTALSPSRATGQAA